MRCTPCGTLMRCVVSDLLCVRSHLLRICVVCITCRVLCGCLQVSWNDLATTTLISVSDWQKKVGIPPRYSSVLKVKYESMKERRS